MTDRSISRREVWIHLLFWMCLFLLNLVPTLAGDREMQGFFLLRFLINPIVFYANYAFLVPLLLLRKRVLSYILVSLTLLIVLNKLANLFLPEIPLVSQTELDQIFQDRKFIPPVQSVRLVMSAMLSTGFFLLGGTIALVKNLYQKEELSKAKEIRQKESEIQFLKAQLNPHFLFNSLNSIYSLVKDKSNDAPEAVISISEMMRYMLYEADKELVPLYKEIEYLKNYISLQSLRLVNHELVGFRATGNYESKKIAPLLLISFIENAFKYGTDFKGKTEVQINMEVIENKLHFECRNQLGQNGKRDKESSGVGLTNIRNRLALLYPDAHELHIKKSEDYFTVNLLLDLNQNEMHNHR